MNNDKIQVLTENVDCALSSLHTLIIAYGFNVNPMRKSAKELLPSYSNQISDMLGIVNEHLTAAQEILREEQTVLTSLQLQNDTKSWNIPKDAEETIIEYCKSGMSLKDISRSLKIYRKPIEGFLLSQGLITKDKCKYF